MLLTNSEVTSATGYVGNFEVKVLKKARYVDEKECTACGDCVEVCPVAVPDEFNAGLSSRRAIYQPFPQAVPAAYAVDIKNCLGHNPIVCGKCMERCEKRAIDFTMSDEEFSFKVGTIVVATGMEKASRISSGRSSSSTRLPCASAAARSMVFSSSRTLPGHEYRKS